MEYVDTLQRVQLGYLLAVPLNERLSQLEDFSMPGMQFMVPRHFLFLHFIVSCVISSPSHLLLFVTAIYFLFMFIYLQVLTRKLCF